MRLADGAARARRVRSRAARRMAMYLRFARVLGEAVTEAGDGGDVPEGGVRSEGEAEDEETKLARARLREMVRRSFRMGGLSGQLDDHAKRHVE